MLCIFFKTVMVCQMQPQEERKERLGDETKPLHSGSGEKVWHTAQGQEVGDGSKGKESIERSPGDTQGRGCARTTRSSKNTWIFSM